MLNFPTFPRRRKSNMVRPTTPTFLSEPEAPPPTKPVVYSPVPTMRTLRGLDVPCSAGLPWIGIASILKVLSHSCKITLSLNRCRL
jgi:hypothetical protein